MVMKSPYRSDSSYRTFSA